MFSFTLCVYSFFPMIFVLIIPRIESILNNLLCQAWADAFRSSPDLTGVVHIYEELKRKGVEFPMADLDALSPIHTPQRVRRKAKTHLLTGHIVRYTFLVLNWAPFCLQNLFNSLCQTNAAH